MSTALAAEPTILHALPGRLRIHLPDWSGGGRRHLETRLRQVPGVRRAEANPTTRNLLVQFDPAATTTQTLLDALRHDRPATPPEPEPERPAVLKEGRGRHKRARIAVRGLDRDPHLARRVVEHLHRRPGVKATASPLTGRVLVEYDAHQTHLHELIADVMDVELPELPGEDRPSHPLDPLPLFQSSTRTVGAALGLGLLALRRLFGLQGPPPGAGGAATASGVITILRGYPALRNGLRRLLGQDAADLAFSLGGVLSLTFSSNPLGLAVIGGESLMLLREVLARRRAWHRYEDRLGGAASSEPGAEIRLEGGERVPRRAEVVEGTGTAVGRNGLPRPVAPGATVGAGARLSGGPFVVRLAGGEVFVPQPRPAPPAPSLYGRYVRALGPVSLAYAGLTALLTRSFRRTFEALLLVNPRTAVIGMECANLEAAARALRAGVTVVGTRPERVVRLPGALLLDGPRVLTNGVELTSVLPLTPQADAAEIQALAGGIAAAAGSPWGTAFPQAGNAPAADGTFDDATASATVDGVRYTLGPPSAHDRVPGIERLRQPGTYLLILRRATDGQALGAIALRPRLASGAAGLVEFCRRRGVELALLPGDDPETAAAVARRAGVEVLDSDDAVAQVRARQQQGTIVAFLSDNARAAAAFDAADLGVGLSSGRSGRFPARADLLAPDLEAVTALLESGARREAAVRDAVGLSLVSNVVGAAWGLRTDPGIGGATRVMYLTALGSLVDDWARMQGGERPGASLAYLADPRPERWGRRSIAAVLRAFTTTPHGLSIARAAERRQKAVALAPGRHELLSALRDQLRSPITKVLTAGGVLALFLGETLDAAIIAATIGINVAAGVWQEHRVGRAAEALKRLNTASARVLRDGQPVTVPAPEVVPGDVLLLAPGNRVAADARLIAAHGLEVDEAVLTGESLPVVKGPDDSHPANRVVLEGSDVVVGTGRAVVVAVGRHTRLGATAAALTIDETEKSPLGARLGHMLRLAIPVALGGGALAMAAGVLRGQTWISQLTLGVTTALSVIPEGLTLLAGMGEAGVSHRLATRRALVRRLAAVEALGRVDVACADKTGTMTEGRLSLRLVADADEEALADRCETLGAELCRVLLTAALASPHPDAPDVSSHPTDVAVIRAAREAGLADGLRARREAEASFDPARSFHAALVDGRLCVKGAPETLAPRCTRLRTRAGDRSLDDEGRHELLARARHFAERGLRVLMVAEGPAGLPEDPQDLTALGFLGIQDPLRPTVREAVRRCHAAGVRVVMLTGDHPATARAIAREAGLPVGGPDEVLTGSEIAELQNGDLDRRLERATVIARATPLDKLRIIESLRRRGHTVAMTGDGVNDAPALRLADVGVAMGRGGTEVARQAADVVLADDDFATLVEALVEGRGFWHNMRRAVGLLLGGNLGELGLIVGTSLAGLGSPLNTRQILVVNLITDALPALAVVLQPPEHRNLSELAREGVAALDVSLRYDVLRRGASSGLPALAAYLLARPNGSMAQASNVAFASIVANQLAQTLDAGWAQGRLSGPVLGAVASSAGLLVSTLTVSPLRNLLGLTAPTAFGWALVGAGAAASVLLSRLLSVATPTVPPTAPPGDRVLALLRQRMNLLPP